MAEPMQNDDKLFFHIHAEFPCRSQIKIKEDFPHGNFEITVIPPPGIPISDTADFKDGNLRVRVTPESMNALWSILNSDNMYGRLNKTSRPKMKIWHLALMMISFGIGVYVHAWVGCAFSFVGTLWLLYISNRQVINETTDLR